MEGGLGGLDGLGRSGVGIWLAVEGMWMWMWDIFSRCLVWRVGGSVGIGDGSMVDWIGLVWILGFGF